MKYSILLALLVLSRTVTAQLTKEDFKAIADTSKNELKEIDPRLKTMELDPFLRFYIPSAILYEGLEPANVSKLNVGLNENRADIKFGFGGNVDPLYSGISNSFAFGVTAQAPENIRTLFKYDKTPKDYALKLFWTHVQSHKLFYTSSGGNKVYTSRQATWWNVVGSLGNSKSYVFSDNQNYAEEQYITYKVMVSFSHYFNSLLKEYCWRNVWNVGVGVGSFDNYKQLKPITLRSGTMVNDLMFSESEVVVGRQGKFAVASGLLLTGSYFYPFTNPRGPTMATLGFNINSFGLTSARHYMNMNAGIYFSKRTPPESPTSAEMKEQFSIGILADFDNAQRLNGGNYYRDNFSIILTAQIPLRFQE